MWWAWCLLGLLAGCQSWPLASAPAAAVQSQRSLPLDEYLTRKRALNEQYLFGSANEALKSLEALAALEEDYAKNGQTPVDSDHACMLAYARLFVLSERLLQRPEAANYLQKALGYAARWRPETAVLPEEKKVEFVRNYVEDFEKGLEVRWKSQLK